MSERGVPAHADAVLPPPASAGGGAVARMLLACSAAARPAASSAASAPGEEEPEVALALRGASFSWYLGGCWVVVRLGLRDPRGDRSVNQVLN